MTLFQFILLLVVAGIAGSIGQSLAGYSRGGCLMSIALGFIGALLGSWLAGILGLPEILAIRIGSESFPIIWSILGAALFVGILSFLSRRRRRIPHDRQP
jgi:LPXTG-motif cell wall-anchored protein